jgi:hypothetical protein
MKPFRLVFGSITDRDNQGKVAGASIPNSWHNEYHLHSVTDTIHTHLFFSAVGDLRMGVEDPKKWCRSNASTRRRRRQWRSEADKNVNTTVGRRLVGELSIKYLNPTSQKIDSMPPPPRLLAGAADCACQASALATPPQLRVIDLPSSLTTPSAHSQSRQLPLTYQWRICACLKVW